MSPLKADFVKRVNFNFAENLFCKAVAELRQQAEIC
jgi:hypothetical protein